MNDQTPQSTELALPEIATLQSMFSTEEGLEPIISRIETEVRAEVPDLSTAKGRKRIASLAYKVSQSKSALDNAGKDLTEDVRAKVAAVNSQRNAVKDRLDKLRDEVRKPLTDWEEAEEKRVADLQERMAQFNLMRVQPTMSSEAIKTIVNEVKAIVIDESWEEFESLAEGARTEALTRWSVDLAAAIQREEEKAELERLRAAELERAQKETEERLAREQAEREEREAAEKAERDRIAKEEAEAAEKRRLEELHAAEKKAAEDAKAKAKQEAEEREAKLRQDVRDAKDREAKAREDERARIAAEIAEEDRLQKEREADLKHRASILADIEKALAPIPIEQIGQALMDGRIPHVVVKI